MQVFTLLRLWSHIAMIMDSILHSNSFETAYQCEQHSRKTDLDEAWSVTSSKPGVTNKSFTLWTGARERAANV